MSTCNVQMYASIFAQIIFDILNIFKSLFKNREHMSRVQKRLARWYDYVIWTQSGKENNDMN
jgi:hypothetical protein